MLFNAQHAIIRLENWTLENDFTILKNKTVAIHFVLIEYMDPVLKLKNYPILFL